MNRAEFMKQLEKLLNNISESERKEALEYYESYFDDAGAENESQVIQELGSPGKVAAIIKADLSSDSSEYGEYTERGYQDSRMQNGEMPIVYGKSSDDAGSASSQKAKDSENKEGFQYQDGKNYQSRAQRGYQAPVKKNATGNLILIIAIIVLSCWIWGPILLGIGGVIIGVAASLVAGVLCVGIGGACALVCGVVFIVVGIIKCFTAPGLGFLEIALGFASLVLAIFMILLFAWIALKVLPWLVRKTVEICQKLTHRKKSKKEVAE